MSGEPPTGARRRGRPPAITRDDVIDAAVVVATREGLDRFTMSQLAQELGVAPMTAYHHVAGRSEVVELVVERLMGRVVVPAPDSAPWDERLKALEASVREHLSCMPGVASGLSRSGSPSARRLVDAVLEILRSAGFDDDTAFRAFAALFTFMVGQLDLDLAIHRAVPAGEGHRFIPLTDPEHAAPTRSADEFFDFGFELLLDGLRARLGDPAGARRPQLM